MSLKLTFGCAVYDDPRGAWMTVRSALMHGRLLGRDDYEILVVDNNPDSKLGKQTKDRIEKMKSLGVKYIPMLTPVGTAPPRQRIFDEAQGEIVCVADSHIIFDTKIHADEKFPLETLISYFDKNPASNDLLGGVIARDDGGTTTHQVDKWGDPKKQTPSWGAWDHDKRGEDYNAEPFEVWGNGMWLFACRKAAWLGFNPHWRSYGGEEGCYHEKVRKAGHKCLCAPFLRASHCFDKPVGMAYPNTAVGKLRNYILGFLEIDKSLDLLYNLFVVSGRIKTDTWLELCKECNLLMGREVKERVAKGEKDNTGKKSNVVKKPTGLPGTEMLAITSSLKISEKVGCDCKTKAKIMDQWGCEGCNSHFWEIVGWFKDGYKRYGWAETMKAASMSLITGLAFKINWNDPFPDIIRESIKRASIKVNANKVSTDKVKENKYAEAT